MINVVLVGLGGFVGSVCRYLLAGGIQKQLPDATYPYGTTVVNLAGCLAIGFLAGWIEMRQLFSPETRIFLLIGVLGGFTTFSTFGYETFMLLRDAQLAAALLNVGFQVIGGLLAVWAGYSLAQLT